MSKDAVLIVTHAVDDHVPLVIPELELLGVESVRFDTEQFNLQARLEVSVRDGVPVTLIDLGDRSISSDEIRAVLFRHVKIPKAPYIDDPEAKHMAESELMAALFGGLLTIDSRWVNHPHANQLTRNKPLQLVAAARLGFNVPDTRITNDPATIRELFTEWDGQMIAKLVGGQLLAADGDDYVIHTAQLTGGDLVSDEALAACPAIYQRAIPKAYELRVTVVGDELFCCRINSQETTAGLVDWRAAKYEEVAHTEYQLDPTTAKRCLAITRHFGLETAGIDLIVTPEDEVVFLEINAAGQWAWVQKQTGMLIAASIARHLAGATVASAR